MKKQDNGLKSMLFDLRWVSQSMLAPTLHHNEHCDSSMLSDFNNILMRADTACSLYIRSLIHPGKIFGADSKSDSSCNQISTGRIFYENPLQ